MGINITLSPVETEFKTFLINYGFIKKIDDSQDEAEGLTKAYKIIINLSPQVPQSHTSDAQRIELLCNAVVVCGWATEPPSSVAILV